MASTWRLGVALLLLAAVACGDDGGTGDAVDASTASAPTVVARAPADGAADVARNPGVSATFSEAMDAATLTAATFTLTTGLPAVPVAGTVIYRDLTAVFWPTAHLSSDETFTATITTGAASAAGVGLAAASSWTFTTGTALAPGRPVVLGAAGDYALLAKSGISTVPTSAVTGDLGVSPAAASSITGFSLTADATNAFATSPQVTGRVFAADDAPPTPANLTAAIGDMGLAFTEAAGRAPDVTGLGAGDVGGQTLAPGVYAWGTGLLISTDVTLTGTASDVWIFQVAQDLAVSSGARVTLAGGAVPAHVFWQVSGSVELGTTAHLEGVVMGQTSITLRTGATVNGRLLAQTAIAIDGATVVEPAP